MSSIEYNKDKLADIAPNANKKALVIGNGAVGSYLAEYIAKMGVGSITCCDIDKYHRDNGAKTSAIIRFPEDDNKEKAKALSARVSEIMIEGGHVNYIHGSIENFGPLAFSEYDFVCAGPDSKAVREYPNQQIMQLPPDQRPTYIFGGTDEEMGMSGCVDTINVCYRCTCEEGSFRSSRKKTSCNDVHYRYNADGAAEKILVSNLASAKAAILMADDIRGYVKSAGRVVNRTRSWNPDVPIPIFPEDAVRRPDCPDCNNIHYPESISFIDASVLKTTLREFFDIIKDKLNREDFELDAHTHIFGEQAFMTFITRNYCRTCGASVDVYKHSGRITEKIQCEECRGAGLPAEGAADGGIVESVYGFRYGECEEKMLDMTLYELGFPIGAYLNIVCMNDATDRFDPRLEEFCFACSGDLKTVFKNHDFMKGDCND